MDVCSESEVRFTCTVNQTQLQWDINFSRGLENSPVLQRYFSDDNTNEREDVITNRATAYIFYLISTNPLISTMIANVSRDLYGARVICRGGFTEEALKDTVTVLGIILLY